MAGSKTASLGRMLTALGVLWMGWAIFTGLFELGGNARDVRLPFLPGLLFFFVGRAMTKAGKREPLPDVGPIPQEPQVRTPTAEPAARRPPPVSRPAPETRFQPETHPSEEPSVGLPDLEDEMLELPPPMTSEEMVAEARRRFAPRPIDRDV